MDQRDDLAAISVFVLPCVLCPEVSADGREWREEILGSHLIASERCGASISLHGFVYFVKLVD